RTRARRSPWASGRRTCTSRPAVTRRTTASTPWSTSSSRSVPRSCSTSRRAPTSSWRASTPPCARSSTTRCGSRSIRSACTSSTRRPSWRSDRVDEEVVGRARDIRLAYLLLAPALLLLSTALAYPVGWEVWTSFTDLSPLKDGSAAYVGLPNYGRLLAGADFWQAAVVTVGYAVVTSVAKLALGLGFALLLARPFRGRVLVFLAVFLPWAYPAGVSVIGWDWTLNPPPTTAYAPFIGQLKFVGDVAFGTAAGAFVSVVLFRIL